MDTDNGRRQLVRYLEDTYALESHLVQVLSDHAREAQDEPIIRQKIEQHLRETEQHRDRVEQRLNALGESKPGMKTSLSSLLGQMLGSIAGTRGAGLAKNARDEYTSEHMEIAQYLQLIAVAQAVGDMETVRMAQLNLRDEMAMQQWLAQHLPEAALRSMEKEGVQLPSGAMQNAQTIPSQVGLGAASQPGYTAGQPGQPAQPGPAQPRQPGMAPGQPGQPAYGPGQPAQPAYGPGQPGPAQPRQPGWQGPGYGEQQGPVAPGTPEPPPIINP